MRTAPIEKFGTMMAFDRELAKSAAQLFQVGRREACSAYNHVDTLLRREPQVFQSRIDAREVNPNFNARSSQRF